ncbi:MAG: FtsX-like permease family protein [Actinomycetota bacterium]
MTALAIAAGVALAVSITVLIASIDRSLGDLGRGLAGPSELRIAGATLRGGLPMGAIAAASEVDGVAHVVPMVQTVVPTQEAIGGEVEPALVLGVDCSVELVLGPFGCDPAALASRKTPLAVGPEQAAGADSVMRTDRGRLALAGTPVVQRLGELGGGRVVVLPLPLAQELLTRPDQVDVAYVLLEDGVAASTVREAMQSAVGSHLPVLAADAPPTGASAVLGSAVPIYSLLGIFALGIGAVLVANTASMSLESRRRELAVLGALGGTPRVVVGTTVVEMVVLGAAGGLLGSFGGFVVARPIVASLSTFTESVAGTPLTTHVSMGSILTGLLLGMGLGGGAALLPARRATRLDVAAELSGRESADRAKPARLGRRAVIWSLVAAIGAVGAWAAPRDGGLEPWQAAVVTPAFLAVILGTLFLSAALAPLLVGRVSGATSGSGSAPVRLALAAARRDHRRTGMLAVAVAAAVSTAFVTEGSSASARASIEASFARNGAGVDIATVPQGEGYGAQVSPELLAALAKVPGVAEVNQGQFHIAGRGGELVVVQAISNNRLTTTVVDGVADPARLDAGEVLIGTGLARRQGIRAGDQVKLTTPSGVVELPVQGVWEEGNNVGANVTMSPALLASLYGPLPPDFVALRPAPGVSEAALADEVHKANLDPELRTRSSAQVASDIADQVDQQFASFRVMQRALVAVLFVAVLSSLLLAGVQRRRELGLLAAVGAEPAGLAQVLLVEAGAVALAGLAICLVSAPMTMWTMNQVLPFVVGFKNDLVFDWFSLVSAGAIAMVVVLLGAAWPARTASRVEVLDALRYE